MYGCVLYICLHETCMKHSVSSNSLMEGKEQIESWGRGGRRGDVGRAEITGTDPLTHSLTHTHTHTLAHTLARSCVCAEIPAPQTWGFQPASLLHHIWTTRAARQARC